MPVCTANNSCPPPARKSPSDVTEDPRATLAELVSIIRRQLGRRLLGLYLFGSLAAGDFYPGRSDLDLVAVLDTDVSDSDLDALRELHAGFEGARPAWRDRIEVLYLSQMVLGTFAAEPRGRVARISPGEPLHQRELGGDIGWIMDWYAVVAGGEVLAGQPPLKIGPSVSEESFRAAVRHQLTEWRVLVRVNSVAYVPAQQGYIVATVCRALYVLATGTQTSKERAVAWVASNHPDDADFVWAAYHAYRADIRGPHDQLIRFVDDAIAEASGLPGATA